MFLARTPIFVVCFIVWQTPFAESHDFLATGTVQSDRRVELAVNATGRVSEVAVEEGTSVVKHAVLVKIEDAELRADLLGAQADLELAEAEVSYNQRSNTRIQNLKRKRSVSEDQVDEARYNLAAAKAKVRSIQARIKKIEAQLRETRLLAPFSGTVTVRAVEVGQLTQPGKPLLVIEDLEKLVLRLRVRETEVGLVRQGDAVSVTFDALNDEKIVGQVVRVVPSGDQSHTFAVEVALPQREGLFPGMFGRAMFTTTPDHTTDSAE